MGLNRRTFLQKAGLGLASLGVSEIALSLLGDKSLAVPVLDRYFQALAQPGGRKLALLVGINQYPHSAALGGCVTDVELQRELLIHRFGFAPSDILTLTESQASRDNIETAFVEHLIEQAKAGDVVVFHFSGYGSRVKMSQEPTTDDAVRLQNSLVPVDGILPSKGTPVANDLLEETLVLLLRSLATDRVTTILDTSYTSVDRVLHGSLRVRSCPKPPAEEPSPGELAFQDQIRLRSKSLVDKLKNSDSLNQKPGIVLTAAGPSELATEGQWYGFSAGLFTYALTQYLWQAAGATTVQISLSHAAGTVKQLVGKEQQPRLMQPKTQQSPLLAYYLPTDPSIGADGVVTAVEENGKTAQLWLAGLPATVLEYYSVNSIVSFYPSQSVAQALSDTQLNVESSENNLQPTNLQPANPQPTNLQLSTPKKIQLQLRSKEGLTAKARVVGAAEADRYPLQVGQLVQESIRLLPRNIGLAIALDVALERIERVDATSAFATIPSVSSV
ncbi:MAG TPA: caspase family protein, partial [Coleofasciculaceae cyanobacterium]